MKEKARFLKRVVILLAVLAALSGLLIFEKFFNPTQRLQSKQPASAVAPKTVYRAGVLLSTAWERVVFTSCGTNLPSYKYSLELPLSLTITKRDYDEHSVYYDAEGGGKAITIACTTLGVGDDICDDKYWTQFKVDGKSYQACYGKQDGIWVLGTLNMARDPSTDAAIAFWAKGIEPSMLKQILSSFKIQNR